MCGAMCFWFNLFQMEHVGTACQNGQSTNKWEKNFKKCNHMKHFWSTNNWASCWILEHMLNCAYQIQYLFPCCMNTIAILSTWKLKPHIDALICWYYYIINYQLQSRSFAWVDQSNWQHSWQGTRPLPLRSQSWKWTKERPHSSNTRHPAPFLSMRRRMDSSWPSCCPGPLATGKVLPANESIWGTMWDVCAEHLDVWTTEAQWT